MNARRAALHAAFRDPPPGWVRVPEAPTLAIRWSREVEFPADHPMRGWPDLHGGKPYANWEPTYTQHVFINLTHPASMPIIRVVRAPWVECRDSEATLTRALAVLADPEAELER